MARLSGLAVTALAKRILARLTVRPRLAVAALRAGLAITPGLWLLCAVLLAALRLILVRAPLGGLVTWVGAVVEGVVLPVIAALVGLVIEWIVVRHEGTGP